MYRVYLLCVMGVMVSGNSDEAKYIDLLPESEKQEFLNRIARRIIEEIQGKDNPEQSHAEVSDDQLNAHHAYVQDLIKEESENLRNERRNYNSKGSLKKDTDDESEKDNVAEEQSNNGDENSQHIDLTLRNNVHKENNKRILSDDSTFNVIPVKVIYDQDGNNNTQSSTSSPGLQQELLNSNLEHKDSFNTENSNLNSSGTEPVDIKPSLASFPKEKDIKTVTELYVTQNDYQVPEDHSIIWINKDIQHFITKKQNLSNNAVNNSTEIHFSTETTSAKGLSKETSHYDDSFETTMSHTQTSINSNKNKETKIDLPLEIDVNFNETNTTLLPPATESNTESNLKISDSTKSQSTIIYVTTVKSTEGTLNTEKKVDNEAKIVHGTNTTDEVILKKGKKPNISRGHLRKRLEISEEYKFETETPQKSQIKPKQKIKQYFVYEVPNDKPIFVEAIQSQRTEQPYVVPIYNYAPKHAYYNAVNRFAINNDNEKLIDKEALDNYEDGRDKEFSLRTGFKLDLSPEYRQYHKVKRGQYKYFTKVPRHSHWEHILNSKFEKNPIFIEHQGKGDFRRTIKRENAKQIRLDEEKLAKIPNNIKYIPLRKRSEIKNASERKKTKKRVNELKVPISDEEDHIGAIKTLLYREKKFEFLRPSDLSMFKPKKRAFNDADSNKPKKKESKKKNIELDYYFGKYKISNKTDDYNNEYPDIEDLITERKHNYDLTNDNLKKYDMKHYRINSYDDCENGCIEMDIRRDDFDAHLDALVKVLKDLIHRDSALLVNYNWLLSTVDLESALTKLIELIKTLEKGNKIHPLDLQLLNYIVYLYNTSRHKLENTIQSNTQSRAVQDINYIVNSFFNYLRRRIALPRNKKKRPGHRVTNPIQFWYKYYIRHGVDTGDTVTRGEKVLKSFKTFLYDLEDNMLELHNALKHIALITRYKDQTWYPDLKNIYLKSASKTQLLQVILHLAASRLFNSIEDTAKNAEEDYLFINNNAEVVMKIEEEFIFVLRILEQIKKNQ